METKRFQIRAVADGDRNWVRSLLRQRSGAAEIVSAAAFIMPTSFGDSLPLQRNSPWDLSRTRWKMGSAKSSLSTLLQNARASARR